MSRFHIEPLLLLALLFTAGCARDRAQRNPASVAEANAVEFLKSEVPAWARENGCFSCHNNGDAARALYLASRKGYRVPAKALADTTAWLTQPQRWDDNKGDPGFSDKRLANLQFAAALLAATEAGLVKNRRALENAARKMAADQAPDGAWPIEPQNAVGSPATYGSALATWMAQRVLNEAEAPEARDAAQKANEWLRRLIPDNVPTAATLLLASAQEAAGRESKRPVPPTRESPARQSATPAFEVGPSLDLLRRAQNRDGGWGPYPDAPPEVFDTALALLALEEIRQAQGVEEMIRRGREFLVATQNADGSWPATTRPSGGESYAQRVSTTGWATLALLATRDRP